MDAQKVFDIHVFVPELNQTLYAHTYKGFADAEAAWLHFLSANPHREPEHVCICVRSDETSYVQG